MTAPHYNHNIADYHNLMELPKPEHPLVSVIRFEDNRRIPVNIPSGLINNFYTIALKKDFTGKLKYGQQDFDFDSGVMHFMAPKQLLSIQHQQGEELKHTGLLLLVHPDFLYNTSLATNISKYDFFSYNTNEALHLSAKEEELITDIINKIAQEYQNNIDKFTQTVIAAQIELILTYSERFYQRQFITRKVSNHSILSQLERVLSAYFNEGELREKGIPSVQFIAELLHVSPNYLTRLLQTLTGQSTKHFIQDKLIDLAKEKLSAGSLSVSEIAYALGFEHPQSFSKLFKIKTNQTPLEFRQSFN